MSIVDSIQLATSEQNLLSPPPMVHLALALLLAPHYTSLTCLPPPSVLPGEILVSDSALYPFINDNAQY